jgi:predicted regulator of Ras-like GTPase activity (Roadblock/LC7/MglB family)
MTRQQELTQIIRDLRRSIPEIRGAMFASIDGLAIAHDFSENYVDRLAAMSATLLSLGRRMVITAELGRFGEIVIHAADGVLIVAGAGDNAVLVVEARATANLALLSRYVRAAAGALAAVPS